MAINFKPINEVPVAEELAEGDTLLINSGGTAKQIDATKVGGSGGGTIIYLKDYTPDESDGNATASPCLDAEMTQVMSTAELAATIASGPVVLYTDAMGVAAWMTPFMSADMGNVWVSFLFMGDSLTQLRYNCSDTAV